ncbi:hypothetical protein DYB37_011537 [Aphanomyces astaci]|uniref:Uncharacterized protein n=1 Tax=Aphanomyces astaci TaxID=112090 RepID=A0A418ENR6_APHAT|nr:hypothetical protein DYB37_011537 [Aphanomyces astaci]
MTLREKVEQERDQANTERDQLEERVRGLRTELRTCKRRAVNLSTYLEQALAEKERISDDLGFTQQRLKVQLAATMSEKRQGVEVTDSGGPRRRRRGGDTTEGQDYALPRVREGRCSTSRDESGSLLCSCSGQERCMAPVAPTAAPAARVQAAQPPEVVSLLGKVRELRTRLREAQDEEAKKYKDLATRVENAIQAQLSSMADQVRELDRQQRSHEEEVAEVEERYRVEVAGHREASRALAIATQRFADVVPAFWDWVSVHFRVTSGPVFDRLLEAWPGCSDPSDPDLAIRSDAIPGVSRAYPHDDFGHGSVVLGRRCFGLNKIGVVHDPRDYRYGIRGCGFEPQLNVGGFGGSLRGGPDHKDFGYGLPWPRSTSISVPTNHPAAQVSTPSSKRPSPGTSTQLTKMARRSDPDAAGPLGASLSRSVDSAYASVVARSLWERYSTTLVSFVPLSWHQLPEWRELDRTLRSFWQKYAPFVYVIVRRGRTRGRGSHRTLLGIAGSLFCVVQAYGVQLLRFMCYPHSY